MKISTLWLRDYVKPKASSEELAHRLTMCGLEVKKMERADGGLVFETEITSNRPDWLSYLGVAREVSALYGTQIQMPKLVEPEKLAAFPQDFAIETKDLDLCPYYTGTILRGIKPVATPAFIKRRLEAVGLRSINFIVDVTNFVLFEYGQPLHAFDLKLLKGNSVIIRRAKAGEQITAIDGKVYSLITKDLVIADSERPIAIAGVMGGKDTEVSGNTQDILLESAFFSPASIRQTSKRLGITTDSSYRFERRVCPEGVTEARERVISLILEYTKVEEVTRMRFVGKKPLKQTTIVLPYEKMERLLGVSVPAVQTEKILKNLGLKILERNKKQIKVSVPTFRGDLVQAVDLIEEVARIWGYSRVPETLPMLVTLPEALAPKLKFQMVHQATCKLAGAGFWEAQNYSIIHGAKYEATAKPEELVKIINTQNKELNLMRPSLMPGLIETVQRNQHRGTKTARFFEIGNIYLASGKELPKEKLMLGLACYGTPEKSWAETPRSLGLYDLKGAMEMLLETFGIVSLEWRESGSSWLEKAAALELFVGEKRLGVIGELSAELLKRFDLELSVACGEIDLEAVMSLITRERLFRAPSKYPSVMRDLSLLVPKSLSSAFVGSTIRQEGNDWLQGVRLFDVYEGKNIPEGVKSLAFALEYQSQARTLSSEEVQAEHMRIAGILQEKYNAELPKARENA